LKLLTVTNHLNRFVVVGVRRLTASLHRTLAPAQGTMIRVGVGRDLHFVAIFLSSGSSSKPSVAKPNETKMFRSVFPYSLEKCYFLP
jgi:hypothetical protein